MNGIVPNVTLKYDKGERLYTIDYEEADITDEIRNSTKPEDIQKCVRTGILPSCYENTAIEVEVQEQSELSCFLLNEDGTVTCPMGNILSKTKMRGKNTIYASKDACRQCTNRCTGSKSYKTVSFGPETRFVPVATAMVTHSTCLEEIRISLYLNLKAAHLLRTRLLTLYLQ
jgi:transposase